MRNKTMNVGVIGLSMGKLHAEGVREVGESQFLLNEEGHKIPAVCLYAVCDIDRHLAEEIGREFSVPHVYTDYKDMIADPALDAVIIATPDQDHREMVEASLAAGKHVLCEKPLASNAKEAREMIRVARQNGVTLMEAMKSTLTPNFRQLRRHLAEAGCLRRYFASYCQYSSRYDKLKAGIVLNAFNPELSNGAMMDLGVYTVYPLVVLFGRPKRISATGLKLSTGVDGQGAVNFEYENLNATVLYSKIADSFLPAEIQGEKGTFILDRIQTIREVKFIPKGGQIQDLSVPASHNEYYYEIAEFIDLIERRLCESTINSHDHSLATLEIIDEVRKQSGIIYPADK